MSMDEGFQRAVAFLKDMCIVEPMPEAYWA